MVFAAHKRASGFDGLVHLRRIAIARGEVRDECCAYHSFADVCDCLVAEVVSELELEWLVLCAFATT